MTETHTREWKRLWKDDYLKWICGFANAAGGVLEIGRDDDGRAVGVADASTLLTEIPNKVQTTMGILVDVELTTEDSLDLVTVRVAPHTQPISYRGEYYYRSGTTNQKLTGPALSRFILEKMNISWDAVTTQRVSRADLDAGAIAAWRRRALRHDRVDASILEESDEDLLRKLELIQDGELTNAAVLLFHPEPHRFYTNASIRIGYFVNDWDVRYHDVIEGNLLHQFDFTYDLLTTKYLKAVISYEGTQRIESFPVPHVAMRETLLNAVVHRDYSQPVETQIRVYRDRMWITNVGHLPKGWSDADLLTSHESKPWNPRIARAFYRAGEIETWGRGIERIIETCRRAGVPTPKISTRPEAFDVEFTFSPEYLAGLGETTQETRQETRKKTSEITRDEASNKTGRKPLGTTARRILDEIGKNPFISAAELAERIDKTQKGIEWQLAKLKKEGYLSRIGPDRGGHWEIIDRPMP